MGTRSNIAIQEKDGSIRAIYCHWDGYLSHNGKMLFEYYPTAAKVRKLIDLGSISSLAPNIGRKTNFDSPKEGQVVAYGRDRGEEDVKADYYTDIDAYIKSFDGVGWIEYIYVFDVNTKAWSYFTPDDKNLRSLKEGLLGHPFKIV
jgi:hypothetical protein